MANFIYTNAKEQIALGAIDLSSDDLRVALVMANSTAGTEPDVPFMDQFTTLDETDATPYTRQALAGKAVAEDSANARAELDANDSVFTALGSSTPGTRNIIGALLFKHVTDDSDSVPIAWIDTGGFPFADDGTDVTLQWDIEGVLHIL